MFIPIVLIDIYSTKKLRKMSWSACNSRTVICLETSYHSYHYKVSFHVSNDALFETIALTEAWKIKVKVDWSSIHFSQNCRIVRFVYHLSHELFHTVAIGLLSEKAP